MRCPASQALSALQTRGITALMWARSSLEIDLAKTKVSPDFLAVLARSLAPSVKGLMLGKTDFAKEGNDLSGFCVLCLALSDASSCAGLLSLDLSDNSLKPDAAVVLAKAMRVNPSVTSVTLLGNRFDDATVEMLLKLKEEKPSLTTICGLKLEQTEASFTGWGLTDKDAKLLAPEIAVSASVTSVTLLGNNFDDATVEMLLKLKEEKPSLITLCGLALDQTEANFKGMNLRPADARLLAPEIIVRPSVTSVRAAVGW